ncbi:MAG: aminoglycoside phosphotransferase family protein [Chloroflexota bacterium]
MNQKPRPSTKQLSNFLTDYHSSTINNLEPISGGFWSSAFTYSVDSEHLVLRLGDMSEGFLMDQQAMQFKNGSLPIPDVLDVGEALGHHYAISRRHFGKFLEDVPVEKSEAAGKALEKLLAGLRSVESSLDDPVLWYNPEAAPDLTWHNWLRGGLIDNPDSISGGWQETLAKNKPINAIFQACQARIEELLPFCPERRDLIHGDLLHQNVLLSEDSSETTAIFSWKCSARGDFLYDVAWCTIWSGWHPGIAATDIWSRTLNAPDLSPADLTDAAPRHHCYELQIAASHFGWYIWTKNDEDLAAVAGAAQEVLERGPRSTSVA